MEASLDRPAWSALTTRQAHLGYGNEWARRYHPDVALFAGLSSETPAAYQALGALLQPLEHVVVQSVNPVVQTDALQVTHLGKVHQMVAGRRRARTRCRRSHWARPIKTTCWGWSSEPDQARSESEPSRWVATSACATKGA